jgi:hypothetical protein
MNLVKTKLLPIQVQFLEEKNGYIQIQELLYTIEPENGSGETVLLSYPSKTYKLKRRRTKILIFNKTFNWKVRP